MTTDQSARERLFNLSNPDKVKEAEAFNSRSNFRPKWTKLKCDFGSLTGPYTIKLDSGTEVERISFNLSNMEVEKSTTPIQITSDKFEIGLPSRENTNSELYLMVESAKEVDPNIVSILEFEGLKDVVMEDSPHTYKGRRTSGKKVPDRRDPTKMVDEWVEADLTTWYYKVLSIGGKGSASTNQEPVGFKEEAVTEALKIIEEAGTDGIKEEDFQGKAIRNKVIQGDSLLTVAVGNGKFIEEMVKEGKLLMDEGVIVKP